MERPLRRLSFFGALGVILVALLSGEAVRRLGSLSRLTDDGNLRSCLYTLQLFLFQNGILLQVVAIEDELDKDLVLSLELAEQADQSAPHPGLVLFGLLFDSRVMFKLDEHLKDLLGILLDLVELLQAM